MEQNYESKLYGLTHWQRERAKKKFVTAKIIIKELEKKFFHRVSLWKCDCFQNEDCWGALDLTQDIMWSNFQGLIKAISKAKTLENIQYGSTEKCLFHAKR